MQAALLGTRIDLFVHAEELYDIKVEPFPQLKTDLSKLPKGTVPYDITLEYIPHTLPHILAMAGVDDPGYKDRKYFITKEPPSKENELATLQVGLYDKGYEELAMHGHLDMLYIHKGEEIEIMLNVM